MIIKVCGMRDPDNIRAVEELLAESQMNMMGFIFWPESKRFVSQRPAYLPERCKRVGVFVDEDIEQVKRIAADYALNIIQLHGTESPDDVRVLRSACGGTIAIIKAFNIATANDLEAIKPYEGIADYFLFDTKTALPGGSGSQFDWNVLSAYSGATPFLLSGGIGPDDVQALNNWFRVSSGSAATKCAGIDLNSRFELAPALKDVTVLRHFLHELNHHL